jgi:selenocysteine lyase/cysteine desulfurase
MIYLDCAATSLQKPVAVRYAVSQAIQTLSSPGRGGYESAMAAADLVLDGRMALGRLFQVPCPEQVVFTSSATHGLNIAIKSLVSPGDKVVVSGYEHNAVMRPLRALRADVTVASSPLFEPEQAIEAFRRALPGAKAAVCCYVSNVFGYILPLADIARLCREQDVPLVVDASQAAGSVPLSFVELGCAFAAMPGHKGLLGPQGTGALLCGDGPVKTLLEGGTGSQSDRADMPDFLPDRLEPGTANVPGIAGLLAGVRWVESKKTMSILCHEQAMRTLFSQRLRQDERIVQFVSKREALQSGVLSVQFPGLDCEEAARRLGEKGIAVRAGLHCAPLAHETAGTLAEGTVRFSFSPFITQSQTERAAKIVLEMLG